MLLVEKFFGVNKVQKINSVLQDFINNTPQISSAVISTPDGFCIASSKFNDNSQEKLAAMSGSIHSLAKSISHEISGHGCDMLILESNLKKIIWCTIQAETTTVVMTFISEDKKLLGELLLSAKQCCKLIQKILNDSQLN
ncbi:roadblock/LC7 domain-containing protein [Psychromonas sp. B3M02]|uniref:roadblock/LC7 domain-containing protein n=1 Tax=Psychromonas sp. B3M02 TaxID=2267226 RepID=UPI0015F0D138|nr:roadblock/LC7 domain-containing protein [Psychromonas sp. B3M02]